MIGDNCTDVYQYGVVDRISPEAPIPIFTMTYKEERPGMAANVASNLINLGCNVNFTYTQPSIKTRIIDLRSKQQIVRIDNDIKSSSLSLTKDIPPCDAIVISDYAKGNISYELVEHLRKIYDGPIFIDTKKTDLARFEGCIIKINSLEYDRLTSIPSTDTDLIVTHGSDGVTWKSFQYPCYKVDVADVTGAGDTFLAALAYKYLETGGNLEFAINFATRAATVTVQHFGVYAPTLEEIECV